MKVLQVTPSFAPARGGIEALVGQLSRALIGRGVQSDVAHVEPGLVRRTRVEAGVSVTTLPLIGLRALGYAPGLTALTDGYDLVHVHDPRIAAISLTLALPPPRPPLILSSHGGFSHTPRLPRLKAFHRNVTAPWLLRTYRLVHAGSEADRVFFEGMGAKVVRVDDGVDVSRFASTALAGPRSLDRWICWGRMSSNKRLDRLIALVAEAKAAGRRIDLLICGDDFHGLAPDLRRQIARAGLGDRVTLGPALSEPELAREIETRGVYVTASEYEGFGLTVIEALAAGLMVVCRNIAPLNRFVTDGDNGFHLAFDGGGGDLRTLERLLTLSREDQTAISARAVATAARYDWNTRVDGFLDLYRQALTS